MLPRTDRFEFLGAKETGIRENITYLIPYNMSIFESKLLWVIFMHVSSRVTEGRAHCFCLRGDYIGQ